MPARTDIKKVLVIGSGPIQIGQGCEFDYSGTQACQALRELGYEVCLINSNPATIMTDPDTAERVYIEPLTLDSIAAIIEKEKPDALLPTVGGQVGLNLFLQLHQEGLLTKFGIQVLGVSAETVMLTEDRHAFRGLLKELGLSVVGGGVALSKSQAHDFARGLSFPMVLRASFTLGGSGGGIVWNQAELDELIGRTFSEEGEGVLAVEESLLGWKEYELEVMRDKQGTFVVVCGVENINPMGVHTGDSVTCAPCMTLSDHEYQNLRNIAKAIFERVGMETGGANIQFAVHPDTGRVIVVEMNPRVSRSSALVSKATGYPIARLAAKLSAGMKLSELKNEMTGSTSAAFEPTIDYVAVKIPRWNFDKFPETSQTLGIQMKSVGEVLAFGRTFRDAFQKAWRSLELGFEGWPELSSDKSIDECLDTPTPELFRAIKSALLRGDTTEQIYGRTQVPRWFLTQLKMLVNCEQRLKTEELNEEVLRAAKQDGFTNQTIAQLTNKRCEDIEKKLNAFGITPTYKCIDSCAGEFASSTNYFYKTYDTFDERKKSRASKIVVLGSGPNRIGQGVEFDYSCVHALKAIQSCGFEAILVNCNPETVSTDWSVSDRLFIEPLHAEDVLDILRAEGPEGVFVQFGGQSPLKLTQTIVQAGFRVLGTSADIIALAEDRKKFAAFAEHNKIRVPEWAIGSTLSECQQAASRIGYPLLVRPSFVLGGRAMRIVRTEADLLGALSNAIDVSQGHPVLLDRYLENAVEYDVDLVCDGESVYIPAVMEHVEEAGIHSGDSVSVIPPVAASEQEQQEILNICKKIALELGVQGLLNVQLAKCNSELYVLEVNPRSSRSVPFVSKAVDVPLAKLGALVALGKRLDSVLPAVPPSQSQLHAVKFPVFPFLKFLDSVPRLGPEMRSIGEVMGRADSAGGAFAKAFSAAGFEFRTAGRIVILTDKVLSERVVDLCCVLSAETQMTPTFLSTRENLENNSFPNAEHTSGNLEKLSEYLLHLKNDPWACVVVLCEQDDALMSRMLCQLHKNALAHKAPFIMTESLFETWGKAVFSTLSLNRVNSI